MSTDSKRKTQTLVRPMSHAVIVHRQARARGQRILSACHELSITSELRLIVPTSLSDRIGHRHVSIATRRHSSFLELCYYFESNNGSKGLHRECSDCTRISRMVSRACRQNETYTQVWQCQRFWDTAGLFMRTEDSIDRHLFRL